MKKIYIAALAMGSVIPSLAQETYENAKLAETELNGTARYVGMGGAMEALGADISTISTNPAGIGLFRKSWVGGSFSVVAQQDAASFSNGKKTTFSFDQAGFVYSARTGYNSFVNFSFNYRKSRNFNYILSAADGLSGASQNKLTYAKAKNGLLYEVDSKTLKPDFDAPYAQCNQLDDIYARNLNYDAVDNTWYAYPADYYTLNRAHKGYISEFDFNLSGNVNDRVYLGMTIGVHDVNYKHYGEYEEFANGQARIRVDDDRSIDGSGFDIKAGIIFRPIEASALRFGLSVASPTFYSLKSSNSTNVVGYNNGQTTMVNNNDSYKFKLYTPWKFGVSAGHTLNQMLALGLSFEYADYSSMDTRKITGSRYDWYYDSYSESSNSDNEMNRHTEQTLKGVATLKVGAELKPDAAMAVRLGYNYQSPMYEESGFKDGTIASQGSYISSATDYTNWKATHRITCGIGYSFGPLNLSAAYQYSVTNGDFMPFMNYLDNTTPADDNVAKSVSLSNKRHQIMATIGYSF